MLVVLEKGKIIITISSNSPENDLLDTQKDIIFLVQNFDPYLEHRFHQVYNLLDAMLPDRRSFESMKKHT